MSEICPICNGLSDSWVLCSKCDAVMQQMGKVEDYMGPYSPYMDMESFDYPNSMTVLGDHQCMHVYQCPHCNSIQHSAVQMMFF